MKRVTKAQRILNDAAMRLEAARIRCQTAQSVLSQSEASLRAHEEAYNALEKELTPTSRKASNKSIASPRAITHTVVDGDAKCGICGNPPGHADHDRTYLQSHDFEPPKSAPRAQGKSKQKSEGASHGQNSEMPAATVTDAVLAASGGD